MAVKAVYQALLNSQSNDIYRIQLIDTDYAGDGADNALYGYGSGNLPRTVDVIHESLSITWEGEDNKLAQPIIGSKLDITFLLSGEDTMNLIDVIKELPEHHLCIQVERHNGGSTSLDTASNWDVYWRGTLVHESVVYAFSCKPLEISMSFTDGLALLKDQPYLDPSDDSDYLSDGLDSALTNSSFAPLRVQIGRCLKRMPHLAMWDDTDDFFTEQIDLFHWNHIDETQDPDEIKSILDKTGCDQRTWYAERKHDGPWFRDSRLVANGSTCYEILSDIMVTMGATLHHSAGKFNVASPFMQESDSTLNGKRKFLMDKRGTIDSAYAYSAYTQPSGYADGTDWPNFINYTDEDDTPYLIDSSRSYLPPAKRVIASHISGGAPLIFKQTAGKVGYVAGVTGAASGSVTPDPVEDNLEINYAYNFPLINAETLIEDGQQLNLRAKITIAVDILSSSDDDFVGAQPVLKMKIKVGNQYLKQNVGLRAGSNFTNDSDFGNIRVALGNIVFPGGSDVDTWLPLEITDDVEWTTVSSFFYLPFLIPGQMEEDLDVIEYEDGNGNVEEYAVGLNTERDENHANQMRFRNALRANEQKSLMLDMVMPAMPSDSSTYTGVELDIECIIYKNDGTTVTLSTDNNDDLHSCRVTDLRLFNGADSYDEDAMYYASLDDANGSETVDVGETAIATRPDNIYGELGALAVGDGHRTTGRASAFGDHWFSESMESFPTTSAGSKNLDLVVRSHFSQRYKVINTYRMTVLTRTHLLEHVVPTRRVKITMGTSDAVLQVQACSINLQEGTMQFSAYEIDRTFSSIATDNSFDQFIQDLGRKGPARIIGETVLGKSRIVGSGGGGGLTQVQEDKLDAITINGSGEITDFTVSSSGKPLTSDEIEDASSTHKFATASQLNQIAQNDADITTNGQAIGEIQGILKSSFTNDGAGVYVDTSDTDKSHVSVTETTGKLQVGQRTIVDMTESSPGTIALKVQAGASGSEAQVTAITITGSSTDNTRATVQITGGDFRSQSPFQFSGGGAFSAGQTVTFAGDTSGIDYGDLDNTPTIQSPLAAADQTLAADRTIDGGGSHELDVHDVSEFKVTNSAGATSFSVTPGAPSTVQVNGNFSVDSAQVTGGSIRLEEANLVGSNYIELKAPLSITDDVTLTFPDGAGSSGQVLQSNGAGTLSWVNKLGDTNPAVKGALTIERVTVGNVPRLYIKGEDNLAGVFLKAPEAISSDVTFQLPETDGTNGQVLQTDGAGNLSFATASGGGGGPIILGNISGRYTWSSADDGERIHTGNFSYGPFNWYSFTSEPSSSTFRAYSAADAVGTTTTSLAASHLLAYGFNVTTTDKKVKIHYAFRLQNAPASSTWGLSLWGADRQASGSTSSSTATLRAETADITQTSNSSSRVFHGTMETTADFAEGVAVLMAENRSGSLTSTTYMYAQFQIELVD